MTARHSGPFPELLEDYLAPASPDLVRQMLTTFANVLVSAEAPDQCNAEYREVSPERVNRGNGYRRREWDTRGRHGRTGDAAAPRGQLLPGVAAGAPPSFRAGPDVGDRPCYVLGVSTHRVEGIAKDLGVTQLSKSQVSALVKHLDVQLDAWCNRPLDVGP